MSLIKNRWVFSTQTNRTQVAGQTLYSPPNCSYNGCPTLLEGEKWGITYGDGSTSSGDVYADTVTIGGLTTRYQAVESALEVSSSFSSVTSSSGLLGMAFSTLNSCYPKKQSTWFDNIKTDLAAELFTADLRKGAAGTYNFGYIDPFLYTGNITYADLITTNSLWEFNATGYQIGSEPLVTKPIDAIADTGTTLLLLPDDIVADYWSMVSGAAYDDATQAYLFPCVSLLPNFTFALGAYRGTIPGSYMNYSQVNSRWCYGGIQNQGDIPFSVFGDILLKAQFVVFDMSGMRVGFANKNL
jgi:hypothetical protein